MSYIEKVKEIFAYLLNIKKLSEKVMRNIEDYDEYYWESQLKKTGSCIINKNSNKKWWIKVGRGSRNLYDKFLRLYEEISKGNEDIELVWGHGLMVWEISNEKIIHPILITNMKLSFNAEKEFFTLNPDGKTIMETSILRGIDVPNLKGISELEKKVGQCNIDPRKIEDVYNIFCELTSYLSVNGKVEKRHIFNISKEISRYPTIYDCPIILLRRNSARLWQREIVNIISGLEEGYPVPKTIQALVEEVKLERNVRDAEQGNEANEKIYFPLAASDEQRELAERISENYGVVVQGPPGTGKTHTIANLVCHLIAQGKRVLVTSERDRALRVLFKKIPEQVKPFCLSILGNDTNSIKEIEELIKRVMSNLSLDRNRLYQELELLEKELDKCKQTQNFLYNKLDEIKRIELKGISFNGKKYKIADIAKWVKKYNKEYSWIEDTINEQQKMPLNEDEFNKLLSLLNEVRKEDKEVYDNIAATIDKSYLSSELCKVIIEFKKLNENYENYRNTIGGWRIPNKNRCDCDNLLVLLEESKIKIEELENDMFGEILNSYNGNEEGREFFNDTAHKCNDYMLMLGKIKDRLKNHTIQIPDSVDIYKFNEHLSVLYNNLNLRGKIGNLFKIIHPECRYITKECAVDGKSAENIEQISIIRLYVHKKIILKELRVLWNNIAKQYGGKLIREAEDNLELLIIEEYIKKLNTVVNWNRNYKNKIISMLGKISLPSNINWYKKDTYEYLIKCIKAIKSLHKYNNLKAYIEVSKKWLSNNEKLGDIYKAIEELDDVRIKYALNKIERVITLKDKLLEIDTLIKKLQSQCPITAKKIINNWEQDVVIYKNWTNAWKWAQWNSLLKDINNVDVENIERSINKEKEKEKKVIGQIVVKRALYYQVIRTTEDKKKSLVTWMEMLKRLSKSTRKNKLKYKKIAQNEMEKCKDIIPVWIMPLNSVIENISLSHNLFDVIIFDEGSQSNIFSICALTRAKKAIIVGDDKQISPEPVGINRQQMEALINNYLKEIPHKELFDLQTSLYDTALRVFPNRLILNEHFRCFPEIINFSNEVCYSRQIKSLRNSSYQQDLQPPIVTVKVSSEYRDERKSLNILEAEVLVDKIVECCKDKKYSGMTFGVISLLGEAQSRLIEKMIKERLGENEITKRKILCGEAYCFQGDERDVMFLSMVISGNEKLIPLTKDSDIRKFNVATSRAKNQMWLFHSVDLKDLNTNCIRYSLLSYCLNYKTHYIVDENLKVYFKSNFQKDVYEALTNRGYLVIPQASLGGHKVDFIVKGVKNRAVVICEGGITLKNNTKKAIEAKLGLEKMGWSVLRIREGEFYYNPEKTMDALWSKLKSIGIEEYDSRDCTYKNLKVV